MNEPRISAGPKSGLVLLLLGIVVVIGYGIWEMMQDDTVPALIKTAIAAVIVGVLLLFVSVLMQRLQDRKEDPYKDVEA